MLLVETVTHLSKWLVHGKPKNLPIESFIVAAEQMLRALLPSRRAASEADPLRRVALE
ncbi:MAG: hypothetical protein QM767_26160 [Anaeromyxobacter sp.]